MLLVCGGMASKFSMKPLSHFAKLSHLSIHAPIPAQSQARLLVEGNRIAGKSKDMGAGAGLSN